MSRSGYVDDDCDQWASIRWRGAVKSALRGRRGQAFLRELLAALYALPEKRLIRDSLVDEYDSNSVCMLGAVGRTRGIDTSVDAYDHERVASLLNVPHAMACEIMWVNDEWWRQSPEERWLRARNWVVDHIADAAHIHQQGTAEKI